jgi:hypothetical protein
MGANPASPDRVGPVVLTTQRGIDDADIEVPVHDRGSVLEETCGRGATGSKAATTSTTVVVGNPTIGSLGGGA